MQWILGAVIVSATTYFGFAVRARGRRRVGQLEEIVRLLRHLETKLCYLREKLVQTVNEVKADASPEFAELLEVYTESIVSGRRSYARLKSVLPRMQLEEEEFAELCALLDGLGQGDADVQARSIGHFVERFGEFRDRAEKRFRAQSGMYPRFGFMGGLLLCILLW